MNKIKFFFGFVLLSFLFIFFVMPNIYAEEIEDYPPSFYIYDNNGELLLEHFENLQSTTNNNGTISSGVTYVSGKVMNGTNIDGTDTITFPASTIDESQGSIEFWLKTNWAPSSKSGNVVFYTSGSNFGTNDYGLEFYFRDSDNNLIFDIGDPTEGNIALGYDISSWGASEWHHVVGMWDSSNQYLYVDGDLKNSDAGTYTGTNRNNVSYVGSSEDGTLQCDCVIDELRILNGFSNISNYHSLSVLISPENGTAVNDTTPTLQWRAATDVDDVDSIYYNVLIATDFAFSQIEQNNTGITTNSYTLTSALSRGEYYWKVKCYNDLNGDWSDIFILNLSNSAPSVPVLLSPTNGQDTVTDRTPELIWQNSTDNDDDDTLTYDLLLDDNSDFSSPILNITSISESGPFNTSHTPISNLDVETPYYWKVRAYDNIDYSGWSSVWNFTILRVVSCSLTNENVDFNQMTIGDVNDTTDESPAAIILDNDGNVKLNITINATDLWTVESNPTDNYRWKVRANGENSWDSATTSWTRFQQIYNAITNLVFDGNNSAKIDVYVATPSDQPPQELSSTINITCTG